MRSHSPRGHLVRRSRAEPTTPSRSPTPRTSHSPDTPKPTATILPRRPRVPPNSCTSRTTPICIRTFFPQLHVFSRIRFPPNVDHRIDDRHRIHHRPGEGRLESHRIRRSTRVRRAAPSTHRGGRDEVDSADLRTARWPVQYHTRSQPPLVHEWTCGARDPGGDRASAADQPGWTSRYRITTAIHSSSRMIVDIRGWPR